jgi:RNA polymerase sigma-70 factor, ECF subfamily
MSVAMTLHDGAATPTPQGEATPAADAAQLADAFRLYSRDLHAVARRRLRDRALAEEAVQETFLRAWRAIHRFDPAIGSWRMWLFAICRNAIIDVARRRTRDAHADHAPDRDDLISDGELERVLARWQAEEALRRMSAPQRHAVTEVHLRGRPYADVAADLGVPVGTVKSRVHQGLMSARQTAGFSSPN